MRTNVCWNASHAAFVGPINMFRICFWRGICCSPGAYLYSFSNLQPRTSCTHISRRLWLAIVCSRNIDELFPSPTCPFAFCIVPLVYDLIKFFFLLSTDFFETAYMAVTWNRIREEKKVISMVIIRIPQSVLELWFIILVFITGEKQTFPGMATDFRTLSCQTLAFYISWTLGPTVSWKNI